MAGNLKAKDEDALALEREQEEMDKEERKKSSINAGLAGAQMDTVQRYGSAVSEHIKVYTGVDYDNQQVSKGLKDLKKSKINPDYAEQNIKQRAGFAAERKTVARENAEKAIKGENGRSVRTDDIPKQKMKDGTSIGGTNDPLADIVEVDANGKLIEGTARQLKYVGNNPDECTKKLLSKDFDKYRENNISIEVPEDYFDEVNANLDSRIKKLEKQIKHSKQSGKTDLANKQCEELDRVKKTKQSLKKGKVTKKEGIEAGIAPELSTAKDIISCSHRAGVEAAKSGAALGGGISFIQNAVAVINGEKTSEDAIVDVATDTAKAAGTSYLTASMGSAIAGTMKNVPSLKQLAETNLPATIAVTVLEVGKTLSKYADGQINEAECLLELGEKGTGMIGASYGAGVGQVLIPIPIVGGMIGSMVGYAMTSAYYNSIAKSLEMKELEHQERLRVIAECEQIAAQTKAYREEMERYLKVYNEEYRRYFDEALSETKAAFASGDADRAIAGANKITQKLGGEVKYNTVSEFRSFLKSDTVDVF